MGAFNCTFSSKFNGNTLNKENSQDLLYGCYILFLKLINLWVRNIDDEIHSYTFVRTIFRIYEVVLSKCFGAIELDDRPNM